MTTGLAPASSGEPSDPAHGGHRRPAGRRRITAADHRPPVPPTHETPAGVRFFAWSSDDGRRSETARVVVSARGLRVSGTIVAVDEDPGGISYALLCDAAGRTRRVTVRSESPDIERSLSLTRTPGGPWLDGLGRPPPQPELDQAVDVELSASVLTAGLALRRLGLHRPGGPRDPIDLVVARIHTPDLGVRAACRRVQVLERTDTVTRLATDGPDGRERWTVDAEGFVVDRDTPDH